MSLYNKIVAVVGSKKAFDDMVKRELVELHDDLVVFNSKGLASTRNNNTLYYHVGKLEDVLGTRPTHATILWDAMQLPEYDSIRERLDIYLERL